MGLKVKRPDQVELLPCPLCGGAARAFKVGTYGQVRCVAEHAGQFTKGCGLKLEHSAGVEHVVERWNTRK